jgi:ATP-dependent DNA helicase RecG
LVTEELIANQIGMRQIKRASKKQSSTSLALTNLKDQLISQLPFELTESQKNVIKQISADLALDQPMMRLLQGDVGSGKTVVAGIAVSIAIDSGFQSVLMAPTELLAEQHKDSFDQWFKPLGIKTALLKSKLKASEKRLLVESIASGDCQVVVGTHALFQESIEYNNLALVIVDEQHRFGVEQRYSLIKKATHDGMVPHQLIMTATPIPRTLAMTAYGDLDNSIISELPSGRGQITTLCLSEDKRDDVVKKVLLEIKKGRQVYWVCPLIEESEEHNRESAEATFKKLSKDLGSHRIGLVHGKLSVDKKNKAMSDFKKQELDLLVATTVIEVGVDVPNASMMIIENTERLGLSQLHQLRGRVGRGEHESFCVMLYKNPLGATAKQRLEVIRSSADGFYISEKDLELRGPGEILGVRQKGVVGLKIADISRDAYLIPKINKVCDQFENNYPEQSKKLVRRWIGNQINYRNV